MLTGEIRNQGDQIWNSFWAGGISNPLEVIEQFTYLLFIRRLNELQTLEERKAARLGKPLARSIFPEGADEKGPPSWGLKKSEGVKFNYIIQQISHLLCPSLSSAVYPNPRLACG